MVEAYRDGILSSDRIEEYKTRFALFQTITDALEKREPAQQMPDLESRDFYELMMAYRHAQIDAAKQFEAVKDWLRKPKYEWD